MCENPTIPDDNSSGSSRVKRFPDLRNIVGSILFIAVMLILDQLTKAYAWNNTAWTERPPGYFGFWNNANYIEASWEYPFFVVVAVAVPLVWWLEHRENRCGLISHLGFMLIWAGIIGNNIIDAFSFGYIRDFIWFQGLGCGNLADQQKYLGSALVVAGFLRKEGYGLPGTIIGIVLTFAVIVAYFAFPR